MNNILKHLERKKIADKNKLECEECQETFNDEENIESIEETGVCVDCGKKLFK